MAGGRYIDQCRIHGVSVQVFYKCIHEVIQAINRHPDIGNPKWPTTVAECEEYGTEWAKLSGPSGDRALFTTAIGMIDGILIETMCPTAKEVPRPDDFKSGHKKKTGLNVQALCDAKKRFLFVSCKTPGKTNDLKAYQHSCLCELIESLPPGFWVGGDAAYVCTDHLIVPYPGQKLDTRRDSFNFYLSQLRVRIENAFALLVGRWGILWRPLRMRLRHQPPVLKCLFKLHNFCIEENDSVLPLVGPRGEPLHPRARTTIEEEFHTNVLEARVEWQTVFQFQRSVQNSTLRDALADLVEHRNFVRPRRLIVADEIDRQRLDLASV